MFVLGLIVGAVGVMVLEVGLLMLVTATGPKVVKRK